MATPHFVDVHNAHRCTVWVLRRLRNADLPARGHQKIASGVSRLSQQLEMDQIRGTEVSRYLGHSSTDVTRRYARQTPDALGRRAAEALERAGLVAIG